jgi:hypothetical protein
MKKVLGLSIVIILTLIASVSAQTISIDSRTVTQVPQNVTVSVYIDSTEDLTGIGFNLSFNPEVVEVVDVKANTTYFKEIEVVDYNVNNNEGWVKVAVINVSIPESYTKSIAVARKPFVDITFRTKRYGTSPLHFTLAEYSKGDFNVTNITALDGYIKVIKPFFFNVSGNAKVLWSKNVSYVDAYDRMAIGDLNGDGKEDVVFYTIDPHRVVALDGDTGNELFNVTVSGEVSRIILKDLNGDGKKDVVAFGWSGSYPEYTHYVIAIRNDGDEIFIHYANDSIGWFNCWNVLFIDIDNDGFKEIIFSTGEGYVLAVDNEWEWGQGLSKVKWVKKYLTYHPPTIKSINNQQKVGIKMYAGDVEYFFDFNGDGLITYTVTGKVLEKVTGPDGKPLTSADERRLTRQTRHPHLADVRPLIQHMLDRGLKLEQEAVALTPRPST